MFGRPGVGNLLEVLFSGRKAFLITSTTVRSLSNTYVKALTFKLHEFGLAYEMNIFSGLLKICHCAVEVGSATLLGVRARKK